MKHDFGNSTAIVNPNFLGFTQIESSGIEPSLEKTLLNETLKGEPIQRIEDRLAEAIKAMTLFNTITMNFINDVGIHFIYKAKDFAIFLNLIGYIHSNLHQSQTDKLKQEFDTLVKQWDKDTRYFSSVAKMVRHPAYQRIIEMGKPILPLLFNELNKHSDHWLVALYAITGEDPAPENSNFEEAVNAWLKWGRDKGYLK